MGNAVVIAACMVSLSGRFYMDVGEIFPKRWKLALLSIKTTSMQFKTWKSSEAKQFLTG